tara:strand:+ start:137 stop:481 length:345 start_codon:yes stop_codon:yes gene_type:complete
MNIELLTQRVEVLEKQIALLLADKNLETSKKDKKVKKEKKSTDSDDETKPKKKRVSGYLLFSSAMREDVKKELFGDDKPKNSEIMVELGKRWKALTDEDREEWNTKAAQAKTYP